MSSRLRVCESWLHVSQRTHENNSFENIQSEWNAIEARRHIQRTDFTELLGRIVGIGHNWTRSHRRRHASVCRAIKAAGAIGENRLQAIGINMIGLLLGIFETQLKNLIGKMHISSFHFFHSSPLKSKFRALCANVKAFNWKISSISTILENSQTYLEYLEEEDLEV